AAGLALPVGARADPIFAGLRRFPFAAGWPSRPRSAPSRTDSSRCRVPDRTGSRGLARRPRPLRLLRPNCRTLPESGGTYPRRATGSGGLSVRWAWLRAIFAVVIVGRPDPWLRRPRSCLLQNY